MHLLFYSWFCRRGSRERKYQTTHQNHLDTDFNTIGDDGQAFAMAAQLHTGKQIELLGITIVTGNQWLDQSVSDCLKAVERLGIQSEVGVYAGAQEPFLHTYFSYQLEQSQFGNATAYIGVYRTSPGSQPLVPAPDGFAASTVARRQSAVEFIIQTIHRHPGEVSLLAVGPLTNIALAMRQDPTTVPLMRQIVIMGGQLYVPGNAYRGAGETNWWFDPESARVVLRARVVRRKIVGLDVTDTVAISNETYDRVAGHQPPTAITILFRDVVERWPYVYDTVALASLWDPTLDLDVRRLYVDVSCAFDAVYGKGLAWDEDPHPGSGVGTISEVGFKIDNDRFFDLYVGLLTRPISSAAT